MPTFKIKEEELRALVAVEVDAMHWAMSKTDKQRFEDGDYEGLLKRSQRLFFLEIAMLFLMTWVIISAAMRQLENADKAEQLYGMMLLVIPVIHGAQFGLQLAKRRRKEAYFSALID